MSLSQNLVHLLYERRRVGIPAGIREKTKLHVADTIGIALAASNGFLATDQVLRALSAGAARGDCHVFGSEQKLPPTLAAFGNSALMHALDFDDIHDLARVHPTPVTLPAALAAAQLSNAPGHFIWDAVALGNELMCRLGLSVGALGTGPASNWFLSQLFGYFGAALASSIVLGLSEEQAISALGYAYMQGAGGKEAGLGIGSTARSVYPAFAAMGGVHASLLAQAGAIGPVGSIDGKAGLFQVYFGNAPTSGQREKLLSKEEWAWTGTDIKLWPSCRLSHAYIVAALEVRDRVAHSKIRSIEISVNPSANNLCQPLADRRRPTTLQDAKYSIPFVTAFTLVHGDATLSNLGPDALHDDAVLDLTSRVVVVENLPDNPGHPPAQISIVTDDGRFDSGVGVVGRLTNEQVKTKFYDCLHYSGLGDEADDLWNALMHLDKVGLAPVFKPRQRSKSTAA